LRAIIPGFENNPILMNEEQTILLAQTAKNAKSYRRSFLDHCRVTRNSLRQKATEHGIDENRLIIPTDGQLVTVLKVPTNKHYAQQLRVFAFKRRVINPQSNLLLALWDISK
jgi:hypothetical protein